MASEHITSAAESHRDARAAQCEMGVSLSILRDKISQAQTALAGWDRATAIRRIGEALNELEAAHGYHAATGDAHRALGRSLDSAKRVLEQKVAA